MLIMEIYDMVYGVTHYKLLVSLLSLYYSFSFILLVKILNLFEDDL